MKLRTKLTYSLFFLFAVIVTLAVVGSYYLSLLASVSTEVTTDNYRTLNYVQAMHSALARIDYAAARGPLSAGVREDVDIERSLDTLGAYLQLQAENVTEPGEGAATAELRVTIEGLRGLVDPREQTEARVPDSASAATRAEIHRALLDVSERLGLIQALNSEAVFLKNEHAARTAHDAILYVSIFATASVIIGWLFAITLPGVIFRPITEFNEALSGVAAGNYDLTLPATAEDEFGALAGTFNRMAAKLKEYEQTNVAKVVLEKKRLDVVIDRIDEGVIGLDSRRRIVFANDRALRLLDVRREEVIDRYAPDLAVRNMLLAELIRTTDDPEAATGASGYVKIVVDDRERFFVHTLLHVPGDPSIADAKGATLGYIILLKDITEFAEKDLAKTHLIATLSHEIKTPVAAIEMCTGLIANEKIGDLTEEQKEYVATIRSNARRINRLITDMADLAKVESGVIELRREKVDPGLLVREAIDGVTIFMREKGMRSRVVGGDVPEIEVDFQKALWVLNNLLINAIRYSPDEGEVRVEIGGGGGFVRIAVCDQGEGVDERIRATIFERYRRLEGDGTEGTGLGLAIAREFVEAMGGEIGLDGEAPSGSRFWVRFPIAGEKR